MADDSAVLVAAVAAAWAATIAAAAEPGDGAGKMGC
jgi:hypothetical protein